MNPGSKKNHDHFPIQSKRVFESVAVPKTRPKSRRSIVVRTSCEADTFVVVRASAVRSEVRDEIAKEEMEVKVRGEGKQDCKQDEADGRTMGDEENEENEVQIVSPVFCVDNLF